MLQIDRNVNEVQGVQADAVPRDLLSSTEPFVLKGAVAEWPFVKAARKSVSSAAQYLLQFYSGATVGVGCGPPEIEGRFFYNDDFTGFNYDRGVVKLDQVLTEILRYEDVDDAPTYYVGSTSIDACLPGFRADNDIAFGDLKPLANIWLGNRTRIAAHYDVPDNLACCAAGHRRFTLFPPEQLENLYVGPLHLTPAGQAISLVDFHDPDFNRFPKFKHAVASARVAELEPGDAIFVPSMWWHHVEGLDNFNVLVNYWWRQTPAYMSTPARVLDHAMLAIRDLPPAQRKVWQDVFRHYIFEADEHSFEHIPERAKGPLAPIDEPTARRLRAELLNQLNR